MMVIDIPNSFLLGWSLEPCAPPQSLGKKKKIQPFAMFVGNQFISYAIGEEKNATFHLKYTALVRCCKDLGIAYELWDPNSRFLRKKPINTFKNNNILKTKDWN